MSNLEKWMREHPGVIYVEPGNPVAEVSLPVSYKGIGFCPDNFGLGIDSCHADCKSGNCMSCWQREAAD